jgi:hypothetical protein
MRTPKNIATVSDEILAEIERGEQVKLAALDAERAAVPVYETEIGELLHKVAEDLRAVPDQVTYNDLDMFLGEQQ